MVKKQKVIRKLKAILSADVKGYSTLMANDEIMTIKTIKQYRQIMSEIIEYHSGRVVDMPGDNIMAEFSSVVNAVQSSVEIQKELKTQNAGLSCEKRLVFRIGINIGDVVQDGDHIYGEGVNIAARIEGLAEPGGICISRGAYDHIRNKLNLGYEYIGEHHVKNIKSPVRVYKVLMSQGDAGKIIGDTPKPILHPGTKVALIIAAIVLILIGYQVFQKLTAPKFEPASIEKMAFPLPEKPSIAVLPFDNISGDDKQDYLSDGFTEDLITSIAKIPRIFVISRQSSFTYKGKPVNVKTVAEELGVRYVLEGSVQKSGEQIRVNVQFIDALTGHHQWSERYDRKIEDLFKLKDEIIFKVATELAVELTEGERARSLSRYTDNLEVWSTHLLATEIFMRHKKESNIRARELYTKVLSLNTDYLPSLYGLAWTHFMDARHGWSNSRKRSFDQAVDSANKALAIDDTYWGAHSILCILHLLKREFEKAEEYLEKARINAPATTDFHSRRAFQLNYLGKPHKAIEHFQEAMRLSPFYPTWYLYHLGLAYHLTGQHEKAIETLKKAVERTPNSIYTHPRLAMIYSDLGQMKEAQTEAAEVLRINPEFTIEGWAKANPFKDLAIVEHRKELLRKAGLPEKSLTPLPEKPSIAVLPFDNMSDDPAQEYFGDGITEDIITALSKTPKMIVISRKSTFRYKGKSIKIQKIGQDLGARFILEGSIRKDGEKIRITAQLIDAQTGHHMWAEKYDREQKNVFPLQDEVTQKIITALQVKLTEGEQARIRSKGSSNLDAYLLVIKARELVRHFNHEDNLKAKEYLRKAIELDPNYAPAYRWLSSSHYIDTWLGSTKSPEQSLQKAVELSQKALSIDNSLGDAHALLGCIYVKQKKYDKSLPEFEKALELYPGGSDTLAMVANQYLYLDKTDEAISLIKKAIEPYPIPPGWALNALAAMYRSKGDYNEALKWSKQAVKEQPNNFISRLNMCSIYSLMGRMEKAHEQAAEVIRIKPNFSLKKFEKGLPYKNPEVKKIYMDAAHRAGLPE